MTRTSDTAIYEAMHLHQSIPNDIVRENTRAIGQMSVKVDKLTVSIEAQSKSIYYLEQVVSDLVTDIEGRCKTRADMIAAQQVKFLALAKRQMVIIISLVTVRAA